MLQEFGNRQYSLRTRSMSYRFLFAVLAIMTVAARLPAQTKAPAPKTYTPPKTPWGDPDLQGTWTRDDSINTPMQRPDNAGDKLYLTEEELAQREAAIARQ